LSERAQDNTAIQQLYICLSFIFIIFLWPLEKIVMDNINGIIVVISIGLAIATFLLNTRRGLQTIELCKECLFLLNNVALKRGQKVFNKYYEYVYIVMMNGYILIGNDTKAIECCSNLLACLRRGGNRDEEGKFTGILGNMYQEQGKYNEAKQLFEKALNIMVETGERRGEGTCYGNLGKVFASLGEYVKAEQYHYKALAISKEIGDKQDEATDYANLGDVFFSVHEFVKAKEYLQKALAINKEIGDREGEARNYSKLGRVLQNLSEHKKAKIHLNKALAIRKEMGDKKGEAANYVKLGNVFQSLGEFGKAKEYLQKALTIQKEIGDKHGEATCSGNLGGLFIRLGDYVKAEEYLRKALTINNDIGSTEGVGANYGNLGTVFYSIGAFDKAEESLQKALKIRKVTGDRKGEAADYGNLGTVFQSLGEYAKAEEYFWTALQINREIGDRNGESTCYGNLGTVFQSLAKYDKAKEYLEKAIATKKEIGDRQGEAVCFGNLGTVSVCLGEYAKAEEYLKKTLLIVKEIGDKKGEASGYRNLGVLFRTLWEFDKALEHFEKALAISKMIGDRQGEAADYGNLGAVFRDLCDYGRATEYLQKALTIRKQIGDRQGEAADYGNLGTVSQCLGQYVKAEEYLQKALAIMKDIGDRRGEVLCYGALGNFFQFLGKYANAREYHEKALGVSKDIGLIEAELESHLFLTMVMVSEGKFSEALVNLLASIQKCHKMRSFLRSNDQFKISLLNKYVFPYETLCVLLCFSGKYYEALNVVELGRARALADLMSAQYSAQNEITVNPQSCVGIEKILQKESNCTCVYISYFHDLVFLWVLKANKPIRFRQTNVNDCLNTKGVAMRTNVDEVFDKETVRRFNAVLEEHCEDRSLSSSHATDPTCTRYVKEGLLGFRLVEEGEDENQRPDPSLAQCYKMLIAPVADLLDSPELIIVPDRHLYKVPFAALSDDNGKPLSETFRIRIVPSLMTLKLIQDSPVAYHSETGALLVGEPKVDRVYYKGRIENLCPLPAARKEAEMIGQLLGSQPLLGQQATKEAVLQRIHSVALIHIAAHGNAERGEIALATPLSTSGIPQEDDYLLTMADISQVRLRAKLVVLSCCHSARGQIRSEGVVGIARAFLGSGARSVLVALWALEDKATEQFMSRFYEHLVSGESASESLHQAMKWMRENGFSDVGQWAPFMLIGDNVTFNFGK